MQNENEKLINNQSRSSPKEKAHQTVIQEPPCSSRVRGQRAERNNCEAEKITERLGGSP